MRALKKQGGSVWWDPTIEPGETWDDVIGAAFDEARCVPALCAEIGSIAMGENGGGRRAAKGHPDSGAAREVVNPLAFRRIQAANLVGWSGAQPHTGFNELARAVARKLSPAGAIAQPPVKSGSGGANFPVRPRPRRNKRRWWRAAT